MTEDEIADKLADLMMDAWPFEMKTEGDIHDSSILVCTFAEMLAPLVRFVDV